MNKTWRYASFDFNIRGVLLLQAFPRNSTLPVRDGARGFRALREWIHLHILVPCFSEFLQPVLALAGVNCRRWSQAGALAVRSRSDGFHSVEVLRAGAPFFYSSAGALAQGSDNTFTPTVRAFREGFHFVIITQQL